MKSRVGGRRISSGHLIIPYTGCVPALSRQHLAPRHRNTLINAATVAILQVCSAPVALGMAGVNSYGGWSSLLWLVASTALYFRLRFPQVTTTISVSALAISTGADTPLLAMWWVAPFLSYHWARHGNPSARRITLVAVVLCSAWGGWDFTQVFAVYDWRPPELAVVWILGSIMCLAITLTSWFTGYTNRLRDLQHQQLLERTRQLEHEREQERRLAAQDERTRIAREMHDIVAHSLSIIIAQADGARFAIGAGSELRSVQKISAETLATIADTSRESLTHLRHLLGVLRTDEAANYAPLPGLAQLPQLIDHMRASGFTVEFTMPETADLHLPPGAELVAYRIVQEALTNVTKHARTTPLIRVRLGLEKHGLAISVENEPVVLRTPSEPGAGRGLMGMRERLDLYGGQLDSGHLPSGGFFIHALIPRQQS